MKMAAPPGWTGRPRQFTLPSVAGQIEGRPAMFRFRRGKVTTSASRSTRSPVGREALIRPRCRTRESCPRDAACRAHGPCSESCTRLVGVFSEMSGKRSNGSLFPSPADPSRTESPHRCPPFIRTSTQPPTSVSRARLSHACSWTGQTSDRQAGSNLKGAEET